MVREVTTLKELGLELGGIPAISAEEGCLDALFLDLSSDQVILVIVVRQEDDIGSRGGDLTEDGGKVRILLVLVGLIDGDGATQGLEERP